METFISPYVDYFICSMIFLGFAWFFGHGRTSGGILIYWILTLISDVFLVIQTFIWVIALVIWIFQTITV